MSSVIRMTPAGPRTQGIFSRQFFQQCPGVLHVGGVKAFGDPAVHRREQVVGLSTLALLLPEAAQAYGRPQLQRFRLLAAGDGSGVLETGFCLGVILLNASEDELPLESIQLRLAPALPSLLHSRQRLVE